MGRGRGVSPLLVSPLLHEASHALEAANRPEVVAVGPDPRVAGWLACSAAAAACAQLMREDLIVPTFVAGGNGGKSREDLGVCRQGVTRRLLLLVRCQIVG